VAGKVCAMLLTSFGFLLFFFDYVVQFGLGVVASRFRLIPKSLCVYYSTLL